MGRTNIKLKFLLFFRTGRERYRAGRLRREAEGVRLEHAQVWTGEKFEISSNKSRNLSYLIDMRLPRVF